MDVSTFQNIRSANKENSYLVSAVTWKLHHSEQQQQQRQQVEEVCGGNPATCLICGQHVGDAHRFPVKICSNTNILADPAAGSGLLCCLHSEKFACRAAVWSLFGQ